MLQLPQNIRNFVPEQSTLWVIQAITESQYGLLCMQVTKREHGSISLEERGRGIQEDGPESRYVLLLHWWRRINAARN